MNTRAMLFSLAMVVVCLSYDTNALPNPQVPATGTPGYQVKEVPKNNVLAGSTDSANGVSFAETGAPAPTAGKTGDVSKEGGKDGSKTAGSKEAVGGQKTAKTTAGAPAPGPKKGAAGTLEAAPGVSFGLPLLLCVGFSALFF